MDFTLGYLVGTLATGSLLLLLEALHLRRETRRWQTARTRHQTAEVDLELAQLRDRPSNAN